MPRRVLRRRWRGASSAAEGGRRPGAVVPAFVPVVICGGSGSRLWPWSRRGLPKPFVTLPGRGQPLIDDTYARLFGAPLPPPDAVITVTAAEYAFLCRERYAAVGGGAPHVVVGEPCGKNTAPAIAVAAEVARRRFGDDALLAVLPADHAIDQAAVYRRVLAAALAAAEGGRIALLGMPPAYAATGFGYVEVGDALGELGDEVFAVARFVEKPDAARAEEFARGGRHLWNGGTFCFGAGVGLAEVGRLAPEVAGGVPAVFAGDAFDVGGAEFLPAAAAYAEFPNISFDYAVMEKTDKAAVVRAADFAWGDVGSWRAVADAVGADADGNRVVGGGGAEGGALLQDCRDCFVAAGGGRLVCGLGVSDVFVLDTPDALLVAAAGRTEEVRAVFEKLRGREEVEAPATVRRPWGSYTVLSEGAGHKVKRIEVAPGGKLSLQSHAHRSEHWTCVCGEMGVVIGEREFVLRADETCYVPLGAKHRMYNATAAEAAVIEVQMGDYLGEDDIVRYEDVYGRVGG